MPEKLGRLHDGRAGLPVHVSVVVRSGRRLLMVREAKDRVRGRWNLPGGHVEPGEDPRDAAVREVREEAQIEVALTGLVGVFTTPVALRFAFAAETSSVEPLPGPDILAVKWVDPDDLLHRDDEELVGADALRPIIRRAVAGVSFPLDVCGTIDV